jgi:hypothetical protein
LQQMSQSVGLVLAACVAAAAITWPCVAAQNCSYNPASGYDLNGGDLPSQPAATNMSTLDECIALCCATGFPCAAASLNPGAPGKRR